MTKFKIVGVKITNSTVTTHDVAELFNDRESAHLHVTTNFTWDMVEIPESSNHFMTLRFHDGDNVYDTFQVHEVEVGE